MKPPWSFFTLIVQLKYQEEHLASLILHPVNGFRIKMTLCNRSYKCFHSPSGGKAEGDQKAYSATNAAIIVPGAQRRSLDYFDVKPDNFCGEPKRGVTGTLPMLVVYR